MSNVPRKWFSGIIDALVLTGLAILLFLSWLGLVKEMDDPEGEE